MTLWSWLKTGKEEKKVNLPPPPTTKPGERPNGPPPPMLMVHSGGTPPEHLVLPPTPVSVSELGRSTATADILESIRKLLDDSNRKNSRKRKKRTNVSDTDSDSDSDSDESDSDGEAEEDTEEAHEKKLAKNWKSHPMELDAFSGETIDWAKWKMDAEIVLYGTGFRKIINSKESARKNPVRNGYLFTLLYKALRTGTAADLCIKKTKKQNGHRLWKSLIEEYEGDPTIVAGAAERLTEKLRRCVMVQGISASTYISRFRTLVKHIQIHDGYKLNSNTIKTKFINNIKDPDYYPFTGQARSTIRDKTFKQLVEELRIFDDNLQDAPETNAKRARRMLDLETIGDGTKPRRVTETDTTKVPLPSTVHPNLQGFLKIRPSQAWGSLLPEHRKFVQGYNAANRHKDPLPHAPSGVTIGPPKDDGDDNSDVGFRRPRRAIVSAQPITTSKSASNHQETQNDSDIDSITEYDGPLLPAGRRVTFHVGIIKLLTGLMGCW